MKKRFYGWWIVFACFLTFGVSTGFPYYNIAFFFDYFRDDHSWPIQFVTLGAPIAVLLTIWAGPAIVPRFSPRLLIVVGTGLTFGAFQWFARMQSQWEYYGAWCLYMLGYFLAGPIPHQIIISNWFKEKRGRAMGITYVGVAVIGSFGNKLGPYLASRMHYTEALSIMGFLLLLAWPLAIFVLKDKPQDVGQLPDGKEQPVETTAAVAVEPAKSFAFLLRKPAFWFLLIGSAASIGSIAAVNFHMKFVFESQGFKDQAMRDQIWGTASFWVLWSSIAGRLLAGYLADKLPRKYVMLVTYLVVAIAIPSLFLVRPEQTGFVYLFALVFGFAMGADYMLIPLMAADQFGLATLARAMSAILPTDTIAQFWFPNFIARLRDFLGGDYHAAMMAVFVTAFLGAIAIGLLPRHRSTDEALQLQDAQRARAKS
ncbi:MAG: MFS transporter [Acidobacteria bacterium]|nr:MFS transporter [Acidobacteriota bacterium]MBI3280339.1 MFS transporter [Acidobacteriota bacterium]